MRFKIAAATLLSFLSLFAGAQPRLHVLRANSPTVAIREGDGPVTHFWDHLNPAVRPVVYYVSKNHVPQKVTFYTDMDSISVTIAAGQCYDFKVVLKGRDTCLAELSSVIPTYHSVSGLDTIPFILGADNYIHLRGSLNGSAPLDLIFDTGASTFVLTEKGLKKVKINLDNVTDNEGTSGFSLEKTSSVNRLRMAGIQWAHLPVLYYNYHGGLNCDGVVGYNIVENKAVEINYDRHIFVLHDPAKLTHSGYGSMPIQQTPEGTFIPASLYDGQRKASGWFLFDTGALLTASSSMPFASENHLTLQTSGKATTKGTGSSFRTSMIAPLPGLVVAGFRLSGVPVQFEPDNQGYYGRDGIIGNLVLKRFNLIINYPGKILYLKPNAEFNEPYNHGNKKRLIMVAGIFILGVAISIHLIRSNRRKRKRKFMTNKGV